MKQLIALIALVLISGCEQSTDTDQLTLPPVTTEGKDILACKIDGDIYISKGMRGDGIFATDGVEVYDSFQLKAYRILSTRTNPKLEELEDAKVQIYVPMSASVNDTITLSYKYQASYTGIALSSTVDDYYSTDYHRGKVIILRNDSSAISGTFEFYAYSPITDKIIHVTDGRFDIEKRN